MRPFGEGVHYHHDCVVTIRLWEFNDEVYTDGVPSCLGCRQWLQVAGRKSFVNFRPHTEVAGRRVLTYVPQHLWPPVVAADKFKGLPSPGVSSYSAVVAESHDLPTDVGGWRNVDLPSEVEYSIYFTISFNSSVTCHKAV